MQQKTRYLRLFLPFMLLCVLLFRLLSVPPSAEQQLAACFGRQVVVQGAVEPLSVHRQEGFSSAVLRCEKVYSDTELAYSGRLRVSVKGELPQAGCVVLKGTLERLDSLRNPGSFDAASYNRVQELGGEYETFTSSILLGMVTLASTGLASTFSTLKSEECLKYILSKKYK